MEILLEEQNGEMSAKLTLDDDTIYINYIHGDHIHSILWALQEKFSNEDHSSKIGKRVDELLDQYC